jgi:hypothetical protein
MVDLEWAHVVIGGVSAAVGAAGGLIAGVWRVAHIEQDLRKEFSQDIAEATHELGMKLTDLAGQFDETLKGLRQKINDVELDGVKNFVAKPDFDDFRKEYREDMRDLKNSIAAIPRTRQ